MNQKRKRYLRKQAKRKAERRSMRVIYVAPSLAVLPPGTYNAKFGAATYKDGALRMVFDIKTEALP